MSAKSIRPLSSLAEVESLTGAVTMKSHFFMNIQKAGWIDVREVACLNCNHCSRHAYKRCENVAFCGQVEAREAAKKSGGREYAAETRLSGNVQRHGLRRAKRVRAGMLIGSECANETEPYIVSVALDSEREWTEQDDSVRAGTCWMGRITVGMPYVRARKCKEGADGLLYCTTECEFNMSSEGVRVVEMEHEEVAVRRSSRASVTSNVKTFRLSKGAVHKLKHRCWQPLS